MRSLLLIAFACSSTLVLRAQDPYYAPPFTVLHSEHIVKRGLSSIFADPYQFESKQVSRSGAVRLNFKYANYPYDPGFLPDCHNYGPAGNTKHFYIAIGPRFTGGIVPECMPHSDSMPFGVGTYFEKANGDVMYIGYSKSDALGQIVFELKNGMGETQSYKEIGGDHLEHPFRVRESVDGGYIGVANYSGKGDGDIGGAEHTKYGDYFSFDIWLFKTDSVGNVLKSLVFGGPNEDAFGDLHVDESGNVTVFLMIGGGGPHDQTGACRASETDWQEGTVDILGLKLDKDLNVLWSRCYGGSGVEAWRGNIRMVPDGRDGYYVATRTSSSDGQLAAHPWNGVRERRETRPEKGSDLWLFHINKDGAITRSTSIPFERAEVGDLALAKDGTLWVGVNILKGYEGLTLNEAYGGTSHAMVLHLDGDLQVLHKRLLGGNGQDNIHSITPLEDATVLIALEHQLSVVNEPSRFLPAADGTNRNSMVFLRASGQTDTLPDPAAYKGGLSLRFDADRNLLHIKAPDTGTYQGYLYAADGRKAGAFMFNAKKHIENIAHLPVGAYTAIITRNNRIWKTGQLEKR